MSILNNIKNGIINLYRWLPIVWSDRQWDEYFLIKILHKKFTLMEKYFERCGIAADHKQQARQCKICRMLCQRIIDDDYITGCPPAEIVSWGPCSIHTDSIVDLGHTTNVLPLEIVTHYEGFIGKTLDPLYDSYMQKQDINYLFSFIAKHSLRWWD